jgi:hypothetical protein
VAGLALSVAEPARGFPDPSGLILGLTCGAVGVVIAWHQPRHPMGWILMGVMVCFSLDAAGTAYALTDYRQHHGVLPLGPVALVAGQSWAPAIVLFGLAFLAYPDGLPRNRWRWLVVGYVLAGAAWAAGAWLLAILAIVRHQVRIGSGGDLLTGQSDGWWSLLSAVFFIGTGAACLAWLGYQAAAWRRSSGAYRQQLKWLITGAAVCAACAAVTVPIDSTAVWLEAVATLAACGLAALPVSIGVGILRFRLYDIDRVISRTLAYTIVTGVLVGVYAGCVLVVTRVLPFSSDVAVALSTLLAATLFNPLRRRVQRAVDRRFNRARYDAEETVTEFASRLQDATNLDAVRLDLAGTVRRALEPEYFSLWLASPFPRAGGPKAEV